jgi:hypothetical protein
LLAVGRKFNSHCGQLDADGWATLPECLLVLEAERSAALDARMGPAIMLIEGIVGTSLESPAFTCKIFGLQ